MHLSRVLYVARLFVQGEKHRRDGSKGAGGGFEAIRTTGLLRPSLGIDATLPASRIALVRHVELHTYAHTYTYTYNANRYARENGRLASIPPFSGLSRTSCGTSPSTSPSTSCDVSVPVHDRRYIRVHMYTGCLESCAFLYGETRSQFFPAFLGKIGSKEIIGLDCNLFPKFATAPCRLLYCLLRAYYWNILGIEITIEGIRSETSVWKSSASVDERLSGNEEGYYARQEFIIAYGNN